MPNETFLQYINNLPTATTPLSGTELAYVEQGGVSKKTAVSNISSGSSPAPPSTSIVTYYISAVGSDSNNGLTPQTPFATITKVNSITPTPGSSFLFRGGDNFSGTIVVAAGGLNGAPITYSSYGNGQATISPGNNNGLTCTDFGNITVSNLIFTGSGITTNTGHGLFLTGVNASCQNFLLSNLTISNFGFIGIYFPVGSLSVPIWSNITITQCTVHDCGQDGIHLAPNNQPAGIGLPQFQAFANVLVDHCTIFNITGQNSFNSSNTNGSGVVAQGINSWTVQYCNIFQNSSKANLANGGTGVSGPAVYTANANNTLWQFNEVWGQSSVGSGNHDGNGLMADFGVSNTLMQYNYIHDNQSAGIATGTLTLSNGANNNINTAIRYNVIANNGLVPPGVSLPIGISLYTFSSSETITGLVIYNNTIIAKGAPNVGSNSAIIDTSIGHAGPMFGIIANNIINGDGNTMLLLYTDDGLRFIGNDYVGGSLVRKVFYKGASYTTIAAWLAATSTNLQEAIDGASVLITAGQDPKLLGTYPIASPIAGGYNPGRVSNFKVSTTNVGLPPGLDLSSILAYQVTTPPVRIAPIDFDFKGGVYTGDVIGSITCSRTATSGTDLLPTSPLGASFNTFSANTLRITPGKGLLIEEARTQFLVNPGTPATQTTASLSNGQYILWVNGTGNATVSAGSASISASFNTFVAVLGRPCLFSVSSPGTVTVTVNGSLNQFQLENDPIGVGLATSFISAIGTRDADVVSCTTANPIGLYFQSFLGGAPGGNSTAYVQFFFNIPQFVQFFATGTLIEDSNSLSYIAVKDAGTGAFNQPHQAFGVAAVGSATTQTANSMLFNTRQAIAARTDQFNGQTLVLDGGTIVTNASLTAPAVGTTTYIGNRAAKDQALNGYIERITTDRGTNVLSGTVLQANTTTVPIASSVLVTAPVAPLAPPVAITAGITQDFFGVQVPNSAGVYPIGASSLP